MRQLKILIRNLLPKQAMHGARRLRYRYLICRGKFHSNEKEYQVIGGLIGEGDTVVDIGANVGHYTLLFSRLVGASGRVVAFEPIPTTFDLLASNVVSAGRDNATLINAAVTDNPSAVRFTVPEDNPYRACQATGGELVVMGIALDTIIDPEKSISLIKVDAEGADESIVRSAANLIKRDRPFVVIELNAEDARALASSFPAYKVWHLDGSHNSILYPSEAEAAVRQALAP